MLLGTCLVALAFTQAPQDTVPLPPLDTAYTAWSQVDTVEVTTINALKELEVWLHIDPWGRVTQTRVMDESLDSSANRDVRWAMADLRFVPEGQLPGWSRVRLPAVSAETKSEPEPSGFTGPTRMPEVYDRKSASELVTRYYPRELRAKHTGGQVMVWVYIDTVGTPTSLLIKQGTGNRALDEAAEAVAWHMNFTPALNRGRAVPVWVAVPITFNTGGVFLKPKPLRSFTLGSKRYPIAEAEANRARSPFPEVIRPAVAERRLSEAFLGARPEEDLGLALELEITDSGEVKKVKVVGSRTRGDKESPAAKAVLEVVKKLRFRPAMESGEPKSVKVSTWLVFQREQGFVPSLKSESCVAPPEMIAAPQFSPVDEPPQLVTPEWEMERIIEDYWPLAYQRKGIRLPFRFWYLIDETGRVCRAKFIKPPSDPFISAKAKQLARRLRFRPARRGGQIVAVWRQELLDLSF